MKRRSSLIVLIATCMTSLLLLTFISPHIVAADATTPAKMRLLRYEGDVEIEDASGKPRDGAEDEILNSGDLLKTGEDSSASVALDEGRIITLDEKSQVEFQKQDGAVEIDVKEGGAFLDVSEKLSSDETMDIKVSGVTVGIRGTIIFVKPGPIPDYAPIEMESVNLEGISPEKDHINITQIGVLEGTAQISYVDNSSRQQSVSVEAGKKATVTEHSIDANGIPEPAVSDLTKEDIEGFVLEQVTHDLETINRVQEACDVVDDIDLSGLAGIYTADGDWTWDSPVTLVAQSASKYYDGQPLTRTSDILVDGLPSIFTVKASAGGSRTDAGESENPVSNYTIYNKAGEDVTRHFTHIDTVSGTLLVVPAPLTIHTGTAEKVYDGTPLTEPDAYVTFYKGSGGREVPWRNTAYVVTESVGSVSYDNQTLYGTCGVTWVNAANPITGERREIQLKAGQKLTVFLSDQAGKQSIELKIEDLSENDLPEELLRLYADNPALLQQACKDTGWNIELLRERIEALPATPSGTATIEQGGLVIRESESDRLMQDLTNIRITVDTEITDYNNRALGSEEVHYTGLAVDESIKVTATGSQTGIGSSTNTYTIDWGTADSRNYEVGEDLGALTVTPASVTVTTGSAEKEYDGTPLTNSEASISGLVNGETATVKATGSITEVGSAENTYTISWNSANSSNYTVSEDLGTLRVTGSKAAVTLTAASAKKTYDGTPLTDDTVTVKGLPSGFTVSATVSGSQTDAGSSDNKIVSFVIYNRDEKDVTAQYPNVTTKNGTLTVKPLSVVFDVGFNAEDDGNVFEYDGLPYLPEWITASYEGVEDPIDPTEWGADDEAGTYSFAFNLPGDAILHLSGTGYTDAGGPYSFEPQSTFSEGEQDNYEISFINNAIQITPKEVTVSTGSKEKVYDGETLFYNNYELTPSDPWVNGKAPQITVTGSRTIVGYTPNTCNIAWKGVNPNNYEVKQKLGTLSVKPVEISLTADCEYDVYSSDIEVLSYGLNVQINNVDSEYYSVVETDDNAWQISFVWGDKIDVSTILIKDDTSFAIIPIYDFVTGDSGNYTFNNIDQEGEFDTQPVIVEEGFGLGTSSTRSDTNKRSLTRDPEKVEEAPADENDDEYADAEDHSTPTDAESDNNEGGTSTPVESAPDGPEPVELSQEEAPAVPVEEVKEEPPVEEPVEKPLEEETQEEPMEKAEGESS